MTHDCHLCLGPHNPELHQIKLELRAWFREQVTMALKPVEEGEKASHLGAMDRAPSHTKKEK